jgi:hypothetical protein
MEQKPPMTMEQAHARMMVDMNNAISPNTDPSYRNRCYAVAETFAGRVSAANKATHLSTIEAQAKTIESLVAALEMIAGKRPCSDNLMSNVAIAESALALAKTEKADVADR